MNVELIVAIILGLLIYIAYQLGSIASNVRKLSSAKENEDV
jgi:hypothetical protein